MPPNILREEDPVAFLRKLRRRISRHENSRYPAFKRETVSLPDVDVTLYHLKFSKYSPLERVSVTNGMENILWVDFSGPKGYVRRNRQRLNQKAGEIYEMAAGILGMELK